METYNVGENGEKKKKKEKKKVDQNVKGQDNFYSFSILMDWRVGLMHGAIYGAVNAVGWDQKHINQVEGYQPIDERHA
ncbi:hypothetical protein Pfo_015350 [Paulownia fortunei]|nr:hypothetical protein Pfo_015350 [Paulownia fortunei]